MNKLHKHYLKTKELEIILQFLQRVNNQFTNPSYSINLEIFQMILTEIEAKGKRKEKEIEQ